MKKIPRPIRIPVPGLKASVGLGQVAKRVTAFAGIRTCGGCQRRAAMLDRRFVFVPGSGSRR